jgi:hypothetical protein
MDTWEVVLILLFLSISILVIANRDVPLPLIEALDNTYVQLVVLACALSLAVLSPPVAIVAISTIVTVYYMRNVVKVQIMRMRRKAELEQEERMEKEAQKAAIAAASASASASASHEEPRIEIRETTNTVTEIIADKEAIEAALQEHESSDSDRTMGDMTNPRKIQSPTGVEAFDQTADNNSLAPTNSSRRALGAVDSPVFTASRETPMGYNELKAPKKLRGYRDNAGQYDLDEMRPLSDVERYETADYMPNRDMGDNKFVPVGSSIDDKVRILTSGVMPSAAPPSNINSVDPKRMR